MMNQFVFIMAALIGCSAALPALPTATAAAVAVQEMVKESSTRNAIIEQAVLQVLESFRKIMLTGNDDVPILDPLQVEKIIIDEELLSQVGVEDSHLQLTGLSVEHLSTFVVHTLSIYRPSLLALRYNVEFEVSIPSIEAHSDHYDLSVHYDGIHIFGNGKMRFSIMEPRLSGQLVVPFSISSSGTSISLDSVNLKFQLGGFKPQIEGLFGSDAVSNFVNKFLEFFLPDVVKTMENEISAVMNSVVFDVGNSILENLDIGSIIGGNLLN